METFWCCIHIAIVFSHRRDVRNNPLGGNSMSMFTRLLAISCLVFGATISPLYAQQQGGVPVRIDNEPDSKCVNSSTDKVWLTLYRVVESKKNGFFSKENQAEIVITVKVQSDPQAPQ